MIMQKVLLWAYLKTDWETKAEEMQTVQIFFCDC